MPFDYINFYPIDWLIIGISLITLFVQPVSLFFCYKGKSHTQKSLCSLITKQTWLPASMVILSFVGDALVRYGLDNDWIPIDENLHSMIYNSLELIRAALILWLFVSLSNSIYAWLKSFANETDHPILLTVLPQIKNSLKFSLIAIVILLLIPEFMITAKSEQIIDKLSGILIIWAWSFLLMQCIYALENIFLYRYGQKLTESFKARKLFTQVKVFRRIALAIVMILAIAATLTLFENVKELGTSILASAGIASIVVGLAAQKSLGNLFAGLQIALTQPIRINDSLILENEFGVVEEISLTHVVIKIWDLRRLIVPINYFIEKPFQNLTRTSTNLLSPTFIYVDYSMPIEPLRAEFAKILQESKLWDRVVGKLQVSDVREGTIQIRALASAKNTSDDYDLRCEIREKLISFIQNNYPQCLSKVRNENYHCAFSCS